MVAKVMVLVGFLMCLGAAGYFFTASTDRWDNVASVVLGVGITLAVVSVAFVR